jgi:hypothetical protein
MVIEIDKSQADKFKQSSHDLDCDTDEKWGRCEMCCGWGVGRSQIVLSIGAEVRVVGCNRVCIITK